MNVSRIGWIGFVAGLVGSVSAQANPASALTEQEFLGEMPVVISVSRLAQRLDETPGAVTILDRDFIRMSGARDVADLLRVVPGFQTTNSFETDAPIVTYHGRVGDWANRVQVLVDGRSVYSGQLLGSAGLGLETLALADIERIEVLRGSNSAAYGARAFLGVINIVSRDPRQTFGTQAQATVGQNGVADLGGSVGWGEDSAVFRVSVDSRGDDGLRKTGSAAGSSGENRVNRANLAGALSLGSATELSLHAGLLDIAAYRGTLIGDVGNPQRMRFMGSGYVQGEWARALSGDEDVKVALSYMRIENKDSFIYDAVGLYRGISISFDAVEQNAAASVQYTRRYSSDLRMVLGTELRSERIDSRAEFDRAGSVETDFARIFGNLEWRIHPQWLLNAGAMLEDSNAVDATLAPRWMLNWTPLRGHTFRAGSSTAFRTPSAYENFADSAFYDINGQNRMPFVVGGEQLRPERIVARELGYLFYLAGRTLTGDVRLFDEHISDGIGPTASNPKTFVNSEDYRITGGELDLVWRPHPAVRVGLSHAAAEVQINQSLNVDRAAFTTQYAVPKTSDALSLMLNLPGGYSASLIYSQAERLALMSAVGKTINIERTDVRLAKNFRLGKSKAELALTVQNLNNPYPDGDRKFYFDSRAMVTLRVEN
jgi:iron complex outermembrane receptor protein